MNQKIFYFWIVYQTSSVRLHRHPRSSSPFQKFGDPLFRWFRWWIWQST